MHLVIKATYKSPQKRVELAIARGINEGGDKVRTVIRRELKVVTNVKAYKSITSRTAEAGVGGNRAAPGRLVYAIVAKRKAIPIKEFPVSVKTGRGGAVDAKTWGVEHVFKRSFAEHGRYMARLTAARFPIRSLLGPNLGKELVKPAMEARFILAVNPTVELLILKQLAKALS